MKHAWVVMAMLVVMPLSWISTANSLNPRDSPRSEGLATAPGAAELFAQNCAKCHGRDGRAKGIKARLAGVRNLTDASWQDRVSDERIFNSINNGKGKMPAFGKKLTEAQVDDLVRLVRTLKK